MKVLARSEFSFEALLMINLFQVYVVVASIYFISGFQSEGFSFLLAFSWRLEVLNLCIIRGRLKINELSIHLKKLGKESQIKLIESRNKKIMKQKLMK